MEVMEKMREIITTSTFEVLEKMFFIFLEPVEAEDLVFDLATEIKFTGPVEGCMKMYLSEGLATLMVKNMLSLEDEEVTAHLKEDCAREAINMVCGNLLRTYDSNRIFNLSIPTYHAYHKNNNNGPLPIHQEPQINQWLSVFDSDGESLGVLLQMQSS